MTVSSVIDVIKSIISARQHIFRA